MSRERYAEKRAGRERDMQLQGVREREISKGIKCVTERQGHRVRESEREREAHSRERERERGKGRE